MSLSNCENICPATTSAGLIGPRPRAPEHCRRASCSRTLRLRSRPFSTARPRCRRGGNARSLTARGDVLDRWYGAALSDDTCVRVLSDDVVAPWAEPDSHDFSLPDALRVASVALPRGTALLVISDFLDMPEHDELPVLLGTRCDCTALVARDPWREDLPLSGFVRVRDVENGASASIFVGKAERRRYINAVHERETRLAQRLDAANWRVEFFDETDGGAALMRAFAVH